MRRDVFEKHRVGPRLVDDARDVRPEVPLVVEAAPPAGDRKGLARIAGAEEIDAPAPSARVEGAEIVEHRRPVQAAIAHPGLEHRDRRRRALDVGGGAIGRQREPDAEFEPAGAGAERQPTDLRRHLTMPSGQDGGSLGRAASKVSFDARGRSGSRLVALKWLIAPQREHLISISWARPLNNNLPQLQRFDSMTHLVLTSRSGDRRWRDGRGAAGCGHAHLQCAVRGPAKRIKNVVRHHRRRCGRSPG